MFMRGRASITRLLLGTCVPQLATALVWLLVASVAAQGLLAPAAARDWLAQTGQRSEEESDSRQPPVEEELDEELALEASRPTRIAAPSCGCQGPLAVVLHRRSAPSKRGHGLFAEMARRNGVGSVLRC
jgi:hypothetical protein